MFVFLFLLFFKFYSQFLAIVEIMSLLRQFQTNLRCINVPRKLVYISRNSQPQQLDAINFLAAAASVDFLRFRYVLAARNNLLTL